MTAKRARPVHMGDQLERLLRQKGWRQVDLQRNLQALQTGPEWSRQRVSQLFAAQEWRASTILAVALATDTSTDYFFGWRVTLPGKVITP